MGLYYRVNRCYQPVRFYLRRNISSMKPLILSGTLALYSLSAMGQAKEYSQAVISTTTNVISSEEEEPSTQEGRGGMNFRNMMDGETRSVTYVKNGLVKTTLRSEMGRSTVYRDNPAKTTTMVIEMMGSKNAYRATDAEQAEMQRRRDSMMAERRRRDNPNATGERPAPPPVEVAYSSETKKIAGYVCRKAYLVTTRFAGIRDSSAVWFTPEFKVKDLLTTGGLNSLPGMRNMTGSLTGLDKIDGFVMGYEMRMGRNRRMEVEVTKVELDKNIDNKEFDIPSSLEIKPMSEMQNMFGGGMRGRN